MAPPPKGDPQRPLHQAIRLTRVLGTLFVGLGLLTLLPRLIMMRRGGGGGLGRGPFVFTSGMLIYVVPGAVYLVCAIFLARRRWWAVVVAILMTTIHFIVAMGILVMIADHGPLRREPLILIPMALVLLFAAVFAALLYYLFRSFEPIRQLPTDADRGFETLPAAAVLVQSVIVPGGTNADSLPR